MTTATNGADVDFSFARKTMHISSIDAVAAKESSRLVELDQEADEAHGIGGQGQSFEGWPLS